MRIITTAAVDVCLRKEEKEKKKLQSTLNPVIKRPSEFMRQRTERIANVRQHFQFVHFTVRPDPQNMIITFWIDVSINDSLKVSSKSSRRYKRTGKSLPLPCCAKSIYKVTNEFAANNPVQPRCALELSD